jgi:outer membrane protein assembly factor BamB
VRGKVPCGSIGFALRVTSFILIAAGTVTRAADWPQFRGPGGRAIAPDAAPLPAEFGPDKNVAWKTPLASGHSSPIVVGDRIFLTTTEQGKLFAVALHRADGKIAWRKEIPSAKLEDTHRTGSPAASTPCAADGRVVFHFGSFGLLCLDFAGKELWRRELPTPNNDFGAASSPVIVEGKVILARDQDADSWLAAFDAATGKELWRTARPGFFRGHSTPFVWEHDGRKELVLTGSIRLASYDPATGKELWTTPGLSRVANATPVSGDGLLFASSWNIGADSSGRMTLPVFTDYLKANDLDADGKLTLAEFPKDDWRGRFTQLDADKDGAVTRAEWTAYEPVVSKAENALFAVVPGSSGDPARIEIAWKKTRGLPYVPSPVWYQGRIHVVKNGGMASAFEAKTGRELYLEERLGALGDYYASPVAADGKVFFASQQGRVVVIAAGDDLKILAVNDLKEPIFATPAIADGKLYVRTAGALYCFGVDPR